MEISIRRTEAREAAYAVATRLPDYFASAGLAVLRTNLATDSLFGAFRGRQMIGFVTYKELNPEAVEITWLAVSPEAHGQGVGSKLVVDSLRLFGAGHKVCEVKTLSEIHPDPGYARTRRFYRHLGFIPLETIHPYPGWGEENPCQIFVKFLG